MIYNNKSVIDTIDRNDGQATQTTTEDEYFALLYKIWEGRDRYDISKIMSVINNII